MTHTVLLVDDDADVLHCLGRMLRNQPYQLYTAHSGEEALNMLKARSVDVIVVDERMPGMSGTDVLAWVARNYPDVVRMTLTGHATTETAVRAINEGRVWYFFTKPCNEAHLAIMIRKALEHRDLLAQRKQLLTTAEHYARNQERCIKDLEVLSRLVSRDVKQPLRLIAQACQAFLEQHPDLLDPKAKSLIEGTLEAVSDVQALVEDLMARVRAWQSTGLYGPAYAEQEATLPGA